MFWLRSKLCIETCHQWKTCDPKTPSLHTRPTLWGNHENDIYELILHLILQVEPIVIHFKAY